MTKDESDVAGWAEHQRRFLVPDLVSLIGDRPDGNEIEQGYVWIDDGWEIRVRRTRVAPDSDGFDGEAPAVLALKGPSVGFTRPEYEVSIALPHAIELMARSIGKVRKTRHDYQDPESGHAWIIDEFGGANAGLVIAEIQLRDGHALATLVVPEWAGQEVTRNPSYSNRALARRPISHWTSRDNPT